MTGPNEPFKRTEISVVSAVSAIEKTNPIDFVLRDAYCENEFEKNPIFVYRRVRRVRREKDESFKKNRNLGGLRDLGGWKNEPNRRPSAGNPKHEPRNPKQRQLFKTNPIYSFWMK